MIQHRASATTTGCVAKTAALGILSALARGASETAGALPFPRRTPRLVGTGRRRVLSRAVISDVEANAAGSHTQQDFSRFFSKGSLRLICSETWLPRCLCAISFIILIRYLSVVIWGSLDYMLPLLSSASRRLPPPLEEGETIASSLKRTRHPSRIAHVDLGAVPPADHRRVL